MNTTGLSQGIRTLREFASAAWPRGLAGLILQVTDLCLAVLLNVARHVRQYDDPRLAAAHARRVEQIYRWALREQLNVVVDCESTGAHALSEKDYRAILDDRVDYGTDPVLLTGRAGYRDTVEFLAAWLGIDYFEAKRRRDDSRLLVSRRAIDGSTVAPRFAALARLHAQDQAVDPRRVARTARQLEKLEPGDTTFDGVPTLPQARHRDGRLLEEHAVDILQGTDDRTAVKKLGQLVSTYRKDHETAATPELGIHKRGTRNGVDEYVVRVAGVQAEQFRSLLAQADNPRTQAGAAARQPAQPPVPEPADLFTSTDPAPQWAIPAGDAPQEGGGAAGADDPRPAPRPVADPPLAEQMEQQVPVPQRRLNALMDALNRPAGNGSAGTITPLVTVRLQVQDLQDLANAKGLTAHGVELDPGQLRQLMCQAKILPIVFDGKSQVIDAGLGQRLFSPLQRQLALARDGGCIVPGCTVPPELIECHHCKWWQHGGRTDIANCACLCRNHHALIHLGILKIVMVDGLAHVLLPGHLDPGQIPRRNSYWG